MLAVSYKKWLDMENKPFHQPLQT